MSCLLASAGLVLLSISHSPLTALLSATVWGAGVCYIWPTMVASVSDRFPRGGAFLIGLMGTAGTLSIFFALPLVGKIYDHAKIKAAGGTEAFQTLSGENLQHVYNAASQASFRSIAALPALLLIVFGIIWFFQRSNAK